MSRLFEALQQSGMDVQQFSPEPHAAAIVAEPVEVVPNAAPSLEQTPRLNISVTDGNDLPVYADPAAIASEKFRLLAFRVRQIQERSQFKKLLVTSSVVQDGKSLISANLALTLAAREKQKVLLIEGDLRQPRLIKIFGVGRPKGLGEWMDQPERACTDFMYRLDDCGLWLLPAGHGKLSALEILNSERLRQLMEQLAGWFDCIIIDSPPLVPLADSHVWESLADASLLVVREGNTPKKILEKTVESMDRGKLIGAVLNEATLGQNKYYHYYSGSESSQGSASVSGEGSK
jgi:capsular exopolysaccharide synthesis family protein